jgi:hypothetical protein
MRGPPEYNGTSHSGSQVGFPGVINDIDFSPRLLYLFGHNQQKFGAADLVVSRVDDDFRRGLSSGLIVFVVAALVFLVLGYLWEW